MVSTKLTYQGETFKFEFSDRRPDELLRPQLFSFPVPPFSQGRWTIHAKKFDSLRGGMDCYDVYLSWANGGGAIKCSQMEHWFDEGKYDDDLWGERRDPSPVPLKIDSGVLLGAGSGSAKIWSIAYPSRPDPRANCFRLALILTNVTIILPLTIPPAPPAPPKLEPPYSKRLTKISSLLLESPQPNDVCFHFSYNRRLFACSKLISKSPHLAGLISSSFSEGQRTTMSEYQATRGQEDDKKRKSHVLDLEVSEEDEPAIDEDSGEVGGTFHHITISDTSYKTYKALLCWLYSYSITFTLLKSAPSTPTSSATPLGVSPKSIYRLAHYLELPELSALALANFKSQLEVENVALELYSELSNDYQEVLDSCLELAIKNWPAVKQSAAMNRVQEEWENESRPRYPKISHALAMKL